MHLKAAGIIGFESYDEVFKIRGYACEAISALLVHPEKKKYIYKFLGIPKSKIDNYARTLRQSLKNIYKSIDWKKYSLVGLTIGPHQLYTSILMAGWIRRHYPNVRIVFGGVVIVGNMGRFILDNYPQVDWCLGGEGEEAFVSLVKTLESNDPHVEEQIPGLWYRHHGEIKHNSSVQLTTLEGMPDPDFDHYFKLFNEDFSISDKEFEAFLPIEYSRGCPNKCAFCSSPINWRGYRIRPEMEIADSLKRLSSRHKLSSIFLIAQELAPRTIHELSNSIASNEMDYNISCSMHAGVSKEMLHNMRSAGFNEIQIGVEALNSNLLKKMNKGTRTIDNLETLKYCEELGINASYSLIIKFPNESQKDIDDSIKVIDFALAYKPVESILDFELQFGSPVYMSPRKYGITKIPSPKVFGVMPRETLFYDFKTQSKRRRYAALQKKCDEWRDLYESARAGGKTLLAFSDCRTFLRIDDRRWKHISVTLEDWARELYLFCDSIRSFDEIKRKFRNVSKKELRRALRQFYELKIMYSEDDDWLSLAIHASPANRPNMPFF